MYIQPGEGGGGDVSRFVNVNTHGLNISHYVEITSFCGGRSHPIPLSVPFYYKFIFLHFNLCIIFNKEFLLYILSVFKQYYKLN